MINKIKQYLFKKKRERKRERGGKRGRRERGKGTGTKTRIKGRILNLQASPCLSLAMFTP